MGVEKVNRDRRYTGGRQLLMLLLFAGAIVAFLIAGKQIPMPSQLVVQHGIAAEPP